MNLKKFLASLLMMVLLLSSLPAFDVVALAAPKYYITVDLTNQIVTIYENGNRTDSGVVRQMICSSGKSGKSTPTGTFTMPKKRYSSERTEWHRLNGAWGKWCTRITGSYLFHSVPYSKKNNNSQSASGLKALGSPASSGCVRLRNDDAYWISMNCLAGTKVKIYKSGKRNDSLRSLLLKSSYTGGESYAEYLGIDDANTLKKGSTGEEVKKLQQRLIDLGYLFSAADGEFGSDTHNAVCNFQRISGLTQTGKVNKSLSKKIFASDAPVAPLMIGSSGAKVSNLQEALKALKMYSGSVSGSFDSATSAAVSNYQKTFGLTVNGEANASVQSSILKKADEIKAQFGDSSYDLVSKTTSVQKAKVKVSSRLNLRAKANTSSKVLAKLKNGTVVTVIAKGKTWSQVTYSKYTGYLKNSYLKFYTDTATKLVYEAIPEPEPTPVPTPTPEPTPTPDPDATPDPNATPTPTPEPTPTPAPVATNTTLSVGATGSGVTNLQQALKELRLYAGDVSGSFDEATAAAVKTFQKGMNLSQDGKATPDLQTAIFKKAAEVKETFTDSDYEASIQKTTIQKAKVNVGKGKNLYMRSKASTSGKKITKVKHGKSVNVIAKGKTWSQVTYGKYSGYMKNSYLKFYKEAANQLVYTPVAAPLMTLELTDADYMMMAAPPAFDGEMLPAESGESATIAPEETMPVLDPEATIAPTEAAEATEAPAETGAPVVTDEPSTTDAPIATEVPVSTETPVATDTPTVNDEPVVTDEPTVTEVPEDDRTLYAVIRRDETPVYSKPEAKEENLIGTVNKGTFFEAEETDDQWTKVIFENERFYVLTEDVILTTDKPVPTPVPTEVPSVAATETPAEPTEAPVEPTEVPAEPTEAPTEPTEVPVEPTEAPAEPTEAPAEPTEAPAESTQAPAEPTGAPADAPIEAKTEPVSEPEIPEEPEDIAA